MFRSLRLKNQTGFTIIEVLIVITVVAIVAFIVANNIQEATAKGRDIERRQDINALQDKLENYYHTHNSYPTTLISALSFDENEQGLLVDPNNQEIKVVAASTSNNKPQSEYNKEQPEAEYTYIPYDCETPAQPADDEAKDDNDDEAENEDETNGDESDEDQAENEDSDDESTDEEEQICKKYVLYSWLETVEEAEIPYQRNNLHN